MPGPGTLPTEGSEASLLALSSSVSVPARGLVLRVRHLDPRNPSPSLVPFSPKSLAHSMPRVNWSLDPQNPASPRLGAWGGEWGAEASLSFSLPSVHNPCISWAPPILYDFKNISSKPYSTPCGNAKIPPMLWSTLVNVFSLPSASERRLLLNSFRVWIGPLTQVCCFVFTAP